MTRTGSADLSGLAIDRDTPPPARRAPRGLLLALAGVILAALALVATALLRPRAAEVSVARAEAVGGAPGASATEVLTASGYVVARQRASVSTEVAGRLEALFVSEGSRVRKGDVLGILRNEDQKAAVASAQAALRSAEAASVEAKASARELGLQLRRSRELLGRGLVSQAEFDEVEAREAVAAARVQSATAEVENARSRLHAARIEYDKTFIRAPFAGAVLRKDAEVGEIVSPSRRAAGSRAARS